MIRAARALILAAGASRRLGRPKALVALPDGQTLLARAVRAATEEGFDPSVTVSAMEDSVRAEAERLGVRLVEVPDAAEGMSASIRAGAASVIDEPAVQGLLILLVDQWRVTREDLSALYSTWEASGFDLAAAAYAGTVGVPAIFGRSHFPHLLALQGDAGARDYLRDPTRVKATIDLPHATTDLDQISDLNALS